MVDMPNPDLPNVGGPGSTTGVMNDLEPEVVEGPFGVPYVKPRGAPRLPDPTSKY